MNLETITKSMAVGARPERRFGSFVWTENQRREKKRDTCQALAGRDHGSVLAGNKRKMYCTWHMGPLGKIFSELLLNQTNGGSVLS